MAKYSLRVRIADINILFESELDRDIVSLKKLFKYHCADFGQEADCTVVLKRQAAFRMPNDAVLQWQSKCLGIGVPERQIGRRRIRFIPKFDSFAVASCYHSKKRDEFYYGMMRDKSWICYHPSERLINYVLFQPPSKDNNHVEYANPLCSIPLMLHVISSINGKYLIHGAAIAIDGKASLFLGKSGSGKSTLCTDLTKQKASFMGDDLVFVYMEDGVPKVGSLLFPAKLYYSSSQEKTSVDVPKEMQTDYCFSVPLAKCYLVQQSGLPTSSVELRPSAELLQHLLNASNGMMMQYDRQQWLATMYSISERVPFYIFEFGDRSTLSTSILNH